MRRGDTFHIISDRVSRRPPMANAGKMVSCHTTRALCVCVWPVRSEGTAGEWLFRLICPDSGIQSYHGEGKRRWELCLLFLCIPTPAPERGTRLKQLQSSRCARAFAPGSISWGIMVIGSGCI